MSWGPFFSVVESRSLTSVVLSLLRSHRRERRACRRFETFVSGESLESRILLFALSSRWSATATNGFGLVQGDATTVTWGIVADGTPIPALGGIVTESDDPSNLVAFLNGIYGTVTPDSDYTDEAWFAHFQSTFDRWSALSGVTYVYAAYDDGAAFSTSKGILSVRADVRIGGHYIDGNSGNLAHNFYPNKGDMVIDTADTLYPSTGNAIRLRNTLAHESGHGLGLQHVSASLSSFLMEPAMNTSIDGPQLDDILGLQRHYGDYFEKNGGNDTSASAISLGSLNGGQTFSIGTAAVSTFVATTTSDLLSIDDELDVDFFSFTMSAAGTVNIQLSPVGPTFNVGPSSGPEASYNASWQSDLMLQLLDTNGTTVLSTANTGGIGVSEAINSFSVPGAGTYYVKVSGSTTDKIQTYRLDITDVASAALTVSLNTGSVAETAGAGASTGTVTRNVADLSSALVVTLGSSDTTEATVPGSVTIAAGQSSATFAIAAVDDAVVDGTQVVTLTASATSYASGTSNLNVTDNDVLTLTVSLSTGSVSVTAGAGASTGTVTRNAADLSSALVVTLGSNDTTEGTVPASVTIAAGQSSATFAIAAVDDAIADGTQVVTLSASATSYVAGSSNLNVTDDETLPLPVITGPTIQTSSLRPVISWSASDGATSYEIWIKNQSTLTNPFLTATATGTSYTPEVDFGIGKYNLWVRAKGPQVYSPWTTQYNFTVSTAVTTHPVDRWQSTSRPLISWNPLPGAVKYDIWINDQLAGITQFIRNQNILATSFTPASDMPLGLYRAWVRGISADGIGASWSQMSEFYVATAPTITSGTNSTFDRTPTFEWNVVTGAVKYEVFVRNLTTGNLDYYPKDITDTQWTPPANLTDGPYRWWAIAVGAFNVRGLWTGPNNVHVGGRPNLLTPVGTGNNSSPTFSWQAVDGAVRYELWVTNQNTMVRVIHETELTSLSFTSSTPLAQAAYRVWVRAVSSAGEFSPWSVTVDFSIASADSSDDDLQVLDDHWMVELVMDESHPFDSRGSATMDLPAGQQESVSRIVNHQRVETDTAGQDAPVSRRVMEDGALPTEVSEQSYDDIERLWESSHDLHQLLTQLSDLWTDKNLRLASNRR